MGMINGNIKKAVRRLAVMAIVLAMATSNLAGAQAVSAKESRKASLSLSKKTLEVGDGFNLKVSGTSKKVVWSSSDTKVASVKNGKVTAKRQGSCKIYAKTGGERLSCVLKVKASGAEKAYKKFMKKHNVLGKNYKSEPYHYFMYDLDGNGVKELFLEYYDGGVRSCFAICTYRNGKVKILAKDGGSPVFYKVKGSKAIAVRGSGGAMSYGYFVYTMKNGKLHKNNYEYENNYGIGEKYTLNGRVISKGKFNKFEKKVREVKTKVYK